MKFDTTPVETGQFSVHPLVESLLSSVADKLRALTLEEQRVIETVPINLKMSGFGEAAKKPGGKDTPRQGKKKHAIPNQDRKLDNELRDKLAEKINRDAPIIQEHTVNGLKLTRNERKKIIAAISLAEGSFVSVNKDFEYHLSDKRAAQIPVTYNKVVHIGLSWGLIQFTQDGGKLGGLLQYMRTKNRQKFDSIFGNNAEELVKVTTASGADESGQIKWQKLTAAQKAQQRASGKEIRGLRVQKIAVTLGGEQKDIWEEPWVSRFKQAGLDEEFQEAQLEYAVTQYVNYPSVVSFVKGQQIQTALGLALVVDRAIQQGPSAAAPTIKKLAKKAGISLPFTGPAEEKKLADYITNNSFEDHRHRVKLLLKDKYRLLTVNLYDWDTYGPDHDK